MLTHPCYCGSAADFSDCCQPIINGKPANTAEELMRSRFSAFCNASVDHLIITLHSSKHSGDERSQLMQTLNENHWLHLTIVKTERGMEKDTTGKVEFIAAYRNANNISYLHENSSFVKENQQWFYVDGEFIDPSKSNALKRTLGRNSPCWCGSGKKFKQCHG